MESIIAAIITAVASIIVALIQADSANKQAAILRQKELQIATHTAKDVNPVPESSQSGITSTLPSEKAATGKFDRYWFWVGGILAVEAVVFGVINEDLTPFVNMLTLIPLATFFLSYFRPVFWGYSAAFVTFLQGVAFLGYILGGGPLGQGDVQVIAILFIANAGVCAFISFIRLRKKLGNLDENKQSPA